jgi:hypothetical protein
VGAEGRILADIFMLELFKVSGLRNFPDVTMDFSKVRDYPFSDKCVSGGSIKTAAIYGDDPRDQTNFGVALFDIVIHLVGNVAMPFICDVDPSIVVSGYGVNFRYVFQFGLDVIDYRYRKSDRYTFTFEQLELNGEVLFCKRDGSDLVSTGNLSRILGPAFDPTVSPVNGGSYLAYLSASNSTCRWGLIYKMAEFVRNMRWFGGLAEKQHIWNKTRVCDYATFALKDKSQADEVICLLENAGFDIPVSTKGMPFGETASDAAKALYIFYCWAAASENISLLFIDGIDAYCHRKLLWILVSLINSLRFTQTVLTSQNAKLISNNLLRPDCYFNLTKGGLISFADATQRKLTLGHNLEKLYMAGEFDGNANLQADSTADDLGEDMAPMSRDMREACEIPDERGVRAVKNLYATSGDDQRKKREELEAFMSAVYRLLDAIRASEEIHDTVAGALTEVEVVLEGWKMHRRISSSFSPPRSMDSF